MDFILQINLSLYPCRKWGNKSAVVEYDHNYPHNNPCGASAINKPFFQPEAVKKVRKHKSSFSKLILCKPSIIFTGTQSFKTILSYSMAQKQFGHPL